MRQGRMKSILPRVSQTLPDSPKMDVGTGNHAGTNSFGDLPSRTVLQDKIRQPRPPHSSRWPLRSGDTINDALMSPSDINLVIGNEMAPIFRDGDWEMAISSSRTGFYSFFVLRARPVIRIAILSHLWPMVVEGEVSKIVK